MKKQVYYFPNSEYEDEIFRCNGPVCIDIEEMERLSKEWEVNKDELLTMFHEATEVEIEKFGIL